MNVDVLTDLPLQQMVAAHVQNRPLATLAVTNRKTSRYFLFDEDNTLCGWRNIKTGEQKIARESNLFIEKAFSGIHVINQLLLTRMHQQGKFSMVDAYLSLAKENTIKGFDHSNTKFIDVGKPESITQAEGMFEN